MEAAEAKQIPLISLLTVLALLAISPQIEAAQDRSKPNIVLIVSDDQGYADLGCIGRNEIKTPNLDRLAREGIRLTSFYVSWPACTPSRGSILTGRYPQRNGLYDMIRNDAADFGVKYTDETYAVTPERILGMDLREIMISQVLKEQGYVNGVFGKWDGGQLKRYLPLQRGFDAYFGFPNTGIDYWTHERYGYPSMYRGNERVKVEGYATELFKDAAVEFIEANKDRPFFLYLPFNAPHGASNFDKPGPQAPKDYTRKMYPEHDPDDPNRRKRVRANYLGCVTYMDDCIGQVLETLDKHNLADNTIVVFFSDNGGGGGSDNSPLRGGKARMFEGGIRVPFVARYPGVIPPGQVSDEFLTSLELFPMLTHLAGAELPEGVIYDGFDMLPVLAGREKSQRTEMYWERRGDKAARIGHYKWVDSARGSGLFDLSKDISEKHDLSDEKPELLKQLKAGFARWKQEMLEAEDRGPFKDF